MTPPITPEGPRLDSLECHYLATNIVSGHAPGSIAEGENYKRAYAAIQKAFAQGVSQERAKWERSIWYIRTHLSANPGLQDTHELLEMVERAMKQSQEGSQK